MSQADRILKRLQRGKVSAWELAAKMGILKYTNRISELRNEGHDIRNSIKIVRGKCHSSYQLAG